MASEAPRPRSVLPVVGREVVERGLDDADGVAVLDLLVVVLDRDDHAATLSLEPAVASAADLDGVIGAGDGDGEVAADGLAGGPQGAVLVVDLDQDVDGNVGQAVAVVVVDVGVAAGEEAVTALEVLDDSTALVTERGGLEQLVHVGVRQQVAGCDFVEQRVRGAGVAVGRSLRRGRGRFAGGGSTRGFGAGVAGAHQGGGGHCADAQERKFLTVHGISR